jgi:hypothetical protein
MGYWEVNRNHIFKEMFIVSKKKKRERERKKGRKKERKREKERERERFPGKMALWMKFCCPGART